MEVHCKAMGLGCGSFGAGWCGSCQARGILCGVRSVECQRAAGAEMPLGRRTEAAYDRQKAILVKGILPGEGVEHF